MCMARSPHVYGMLASQELGGGYAQPAQRRRWIAPLPARFGDDQAALPDPDGGAGRSDEMPEEVSSCSVQYVRRPAQLLAVRRRRATHTH